MYWIIPSWILSLILVFFLGYYYNKLTKKIDKLETVVKKTMEKKQPEIPEPKSVLIDELDEVQVAIAEHDRLMKKLNP